MDKNNIDKEIERFGEILHAKFFESFPDTFDVTKIISAEEYNKTNPCMYTWYIKFINTFDGINISPKYKQTDEEIINQDYTYLTRFIDDFEKSEDWLAFLITNIVNMKP